MQIQVQMQIQERPEILILYLNLHLNLKILKPKSNYLNLLNTHSTTVDISVSSPYKRHLEYADDSFFYSNDNFS